MKALNPYSIHPTVIIGDNVIVGQNVTIGAYAIVNDNVTIGDDCIIGPHCILGEPLANFYKNSSYTNPPLTIGKGSLIRSGTILYAGSQVGMGFESGHRVTIHENSLIAENVRIGTLSDIQGYCEIGRYVRLHSNVNIG